MKNRKRAYPTNRGLATQAAALCRWQRARLLCGCGLLLLLGGLLVLACEPPTLLRPGLTSCPGNPGGVDVAHSPSHCQGCGKACNDGQICGPKGCAWCPETRPERCTNPDAKDWKDCFDLSSSATHCGKCGTKCEGNKRCLSGVCACAPGQSLCGSTCADLRVDGKNCGKCGAACGPKESCHQGRCVDQACASISDRLKLCAGGCVNTKKDPAHCGKCGNACGSGQRCAEGTCECLPGTQRCGDKCVDLRTHWEHCGKCDSACQAGEVCTAGKCEAYCPEATPHRCQGGCFHTDFSSEHCGKCGNRCRGGSFCDAGKCACEPGWLLCNGRCVNVQNDPLHCGKCGERCSGICSQGSCGTCLDKARQCGDDCCDKPDCCSSGGKLRCIDTQTNPNHCGVCDNKCPTGKACVSGVCEGAAPCPAGKTRCGPDCADLQTDPKHCGRCGLACAAGKACKAGVCDAGTPCPGGKTRCGADCVDTQTDPKHCGKCNTACAAGKACKAGTCDGAVAAGWPLTMKSASTFVMHTLREGSLYVSGTFSVGISAGGKAYPGKNGRDAFVAKWTDKGALSWVTTITSDASLSSAHVAPGPNGESVVVGDFGLNTPGSIKIGPDTLKNAGSIDLFVARLSASGQVLWALSAGGTGHDSAHDVAFDGKGNIYLAGFIQNKVKFGATELDAGPNGKPFLAKIDAGTKAFSWAILLEVDAYSNGQDALALRIQGNALVISTFFAGEATFGPHKLKSHHPFINDLFVAHFDLQKQTFSWASHIGPLGRQRVVLTLDAAGNTYLASSHLGAKLSFNQGAKPVVDLGPGAHGQSITVAKLDTKGALVWAKAADALSSPAGTAKGYTQSIGVSAQGEVFLGIAINGGVIAVTKDLRLSGPNRGQSSYVIGLDKQGNWHPWTQRVGPTSVVLRGLLVNAAGEVVVGGNYRSPGGNLSPTEKLPPLQARENGLFLWKFKKP